MPRDALARRLGETVARLLDQALDNMPEPLSPLGEVPSWHVRLSFAEPITEPADLMLATERLTADLVQRLSREGIGARRLDLAFHRVDGRVEHIRLGTARPSRDPRHLAALLAARLETVDPGLGVEDMILAVFAVEQLPPEQIAIGPSRLKKDPTALLRNALSPAGGEGGDEGTSANSRPAPLTLPSPPSGRRGSSNNGGKENIADGGDWDAIAPLLDR